LRCDENSLTRDPGDPICKSKEEIDEFLEDIEVEIIVMNK